MAIYRNRHWTDIPHPSLDGRRQRKIGNHLNYRGPGGLFLPAQANVQEAQGAPPNWSGQFDFRDTSEAAPLQFFAHDTTDPDNRAMIGVRIDDTPDVWVNIKAADVVPEVATQSPDSITREWPGLWTNSTLRWIHGGHKAVKEIVLSGPGHPGYFDFLLRISPGASFELTDNVYRVRDPQGEEKIVSRAPYGWDSSADPELGFPANIRCTLTYLGTEGPGGMYHRVRLTPNPDDLTGAVYPVTLDPTATISGATAIDDNYIQLGSLKDRNWGGVATLLMALNYRAVITRLDETLIPAGIITGFVAVCGATTTTTVTLEAYKITAANAGWNPGTSLGTSEVGASCSHYHTYNTVLWAGSEWLNTSGTDYVADASPPTITDSFTSGVAFDFDFGATGALWCTDWRDTPSNNAGIKIICLDSGGFSMTACDNSTNPMKYEIDYTVSTGQPAWIRWTPPHVGGKNALFRGSF